MGNHLMSTYKPLPVSFNKGDGIYVWDKDDNQYLDALCGISVTSLGHNHPAVTQAINEQASRLLHTSNLYHIDNQVKLADLLCDLSGMEQVFFSNSGAEANEAAIKLARLFGHQNNIDKPEIVVMQDSFHGRTMATLSATGNRKVQAGFEPLVSGFTRAPYNDIKALKAIAENNKNVVAILVEPVQGEGGINIPDIGYLKEIRKLCDKHNWLMMLDEIQTGMARSGKMFAFQHESIKPDVLTLAKALGNGIPVGACLASGKAKDVFQPGNHGSTFGGNPFACQVAFTVTSIMSDEKLADNAQARGQQLVDTLKQQLSDNDDIVEIRNLGLLVGITLKQSCHEIVTIALQNKLLINVTAENVIRLLPPLVINEQQTSEIADRLVKSIKQFTNK
ncbi:MAG: aspartate aminotransferase family protein [Gammaproteobacteria bacterium]|nr:aspartate aminotransferase family protein [Gammaproteobacteria bacterium]MBT7045523.1 aspartate aminotransferase family protein [Gammaproteobacteria bacterium]MBT7206514.1 aspartate aminotransferase family protein [Gammaproteobacteria bacterium]